MKEHYTSRKGLKLQFTVLAPDTKMSTEKENIVQVLDIPSKEVLDFSLFEWGA